MSDTDIEPTPPKILTTLTVNLTSDALAALSEASERLGDSKTDTVNQALQLYAMVTALDVGESVTHAVRDGDDPTTVVRIRTPRALRAAIREANP